MSRARSAARTEFLAYVLSAAFEGGIGYWSVADDIERSGDYPDGDWNYAAMTLFEHDGDNAPGDCELAEGICQGHRVTLDTVAHGVSLYVKSDYRLAPAVRQASRENDAGDIDADLADVIVQLGIFGEIVYG